MTKLKIPQGISDFKELREQGYHYIDKSNFVYEMIDASAKALLIPRPRRFGKTLNMTTLQTWFERLPEGGTNTHLLDGLKADKTPGEHHDKRGKIPVIFITFKDIKEKTWEATLNKISRNIKNEIRRLEPWWSNKNIHHTLLSDLEELLSETKDQPLLSEALKILTEVLAQVSGEPPLLLVDEYDTPIHAGIQGGFFTDAVDFFRNFLSAGLKDNSHLWKGVMTGILRVSKENLFSGLNNLTVCSLTSMEFDTCFGLLESEVKELLQNTDLDDKFDDVKHWYNGYMFGKQMVYNPWSLVNFVARPHEGFKAHWINTASTSLLGKVIEDSDGILRKELEQLLREEDVEKPINEHITYHKDGIRPEDVWSFLLFTGYLTLVAPPVRQGRLLNAKLRLPNEEVKIAFEDLIAEWTREKLGHNENVLQMLEALATGDQETFEQNFTQLVQNTLSFHDVTSSRAEAFYHAFVVGMLVYMSPTHDVRSNRESGLGRYDLMLEPKDKSKYSGVVIEFKIVKKNSTIEGTIEEAHKQIIDKNYATELEAKGCSQVLRWAIVFKGKEVAIDLR